MTKDVELKKAPLMGRLGAAVMAGAVMMPSVSHAGTNDFSTVAKSISDSISGIPGLLTALAYLMGVVLGILGVLKIKDHVENPTQTPLKDGAIRLAIGGALFALPMLFQVMFNTVDEGGQGIGVAAIKKASFTLS
ncbi:MAG: hypothetical protein KDI46_06275 [Alphaproteobacteria bacterium]|nr:hypothetical protein [Alphaproteobacteria bacterium]